MGTGTAVGGSVALKMLSAGFDYNVLIDQANPTAYHGGTISVGVGAKSFPAEWHGAAGYTWVWPICNVFDVLENILGR